MSSTTAQSGAASLNLNLAGGGTQPAALEWRFSYSGTEVSGLTVTSGPALSSAGKTLSCTGATGSYTCVASGINQNIIPDGTVAVVSVTLAPGAAGGTVQVTNTVAATLDGSAIAVSGSAGAVTAAAQTTTPALAGLQCSPATVASGGTSACTVTLSAAASSGATIAISDNSAALTVPASVTVTAGATAAGFNATAGTVAANQAVTVTATLSGIAKTASVTVTPPATAPAASSNIAGQATVTVSSENTSTGQLGIKAIDGVIDGYPGDYTKEWATTGQLAGAWIQLNWGSPMTVSEVVLYDRPNLADNVTAGTLLFSDGSTVGVGTLPNNGAAQHVTFAARTITWVRFRVDAAVGSNIGLAEMQVTGGAAVPTTNLAPNATVTVSSEDTSTGQLGIKAIDGVIDGYPGDYTKEWATTGQLAGAWIRLTWASPVTLSSVVLYDRPNLVDNVTAGTLSFSDGSTVAVGALPSNGAAATYSFAPKTVTWVQFYVTGAVGSNIGLAEMRAFGF